MQTSPLPASLRAAAGLALAPPLVVAFAVCGVSHAGDGFSSHALPDFARAWLMAGYFVEVLVFLPVYLFVRRYADMSCPARLTILGAYSAWTAPVAYMLLLTVWRSDFLNVFVIDASNYLLSPANALLGALGGLIFWLVAAAPTFPRAALWRLAARIGPLHALPARLLANGDL